LGARVASTDYMNTWLTSSSAFESLFRNSPYGIAAVDRNGVLVAANPAFARITGFSADRVVGCSTHDTDRLAVRAFADEALDAAYTGESLSREIELQRSDGTSIWCEVTSIPAGGESDVHAFFAVQDVTWRSGEPSPGAVTEIGQLRANFRLLFEHNPAAVLALDNQLAVIDANPAALRSSGYKREEIVGRAAADLVPPSQRDHLRIFLGQALHGETVAFPLDAYAADGRLVQYEATALPIVSQNRVAGVYALLENVTERMRAERTVAAQREELIDLETDLRSLFDRNPDGIMLFSVDGTLLDVNEAAARIAEAPKEDLVGRNMRELVDEAAYARIWPFFLRAADGETVRYEIATSRRTGNELDASVTLFPKYAQGVVIGVYSMFADITDRRISQRKIERQSQRIRDLYLLATGPDTDAQVMAALQTGCRLLAMESGAILLEGADGALSLEVRYDTLEPLAPGAGDFIGIAHSVMRHREPVSGTRETADGSSMGWIGARLSIGAGPHGALIFSCRAQRAAAFEETDLDTLALMSALVGSAMERRRTRGRLRTLAYYDPLTGLPNRVFFLERLHDALTDTEGHPNPLAVLFVDLDRFKDINDTLGHAMGDRFLQMVAHRLDTALDGGTIIARMSGDEFAALLPGVSGTEPARETASRLLEEIEKPFHLDEFEQFVTASVGISCFPRDGREAQVLIKNAEIAMYDVKDRGGNGYRFYDAALEAPVHTRLAQQKTLRRALERDEFILHYQPIIDVASEALVGVEALVRWNDPARGLVFPDQFIPTAEASGLIVDLGELIVARAAGFIREWHNRAVPLTLAVNISARQFHQTDLCDRLAEILREARLDPKWVEIEITESMAISDIPHAVDTVRRLKALGAHIGVDDFGTGHSSLNYLRRFEIDHIKIDRSFIAGIAREQSDETIVRAMIAMGHSLGLTIVAEGVETLEQLQLLRQYGCDRAQGYFFSPGLDAQGLEAYAAARGTRKGAQ